jgi:enterochelin esterase-like enzyme
MGAKTGEKIHQSAYVASNWTRLIYMPSNSNCEGSAVKYVVVWFTDAGQHALRFPTLEQANKFKDILIADEHDEIYVTEVVSEVKK